MTTPATEIHSPSRRRSPAKRSSGGGRDGSKSHTLVKLALPLSVACCVIFLVMWQNRLLSFDPTTMGDRNAASASLRNNFVRGFAESETGWNHANPLAVPKGQAKNLPSIRVEEAKHDENVDAVRKIYGGAGDKAHLGGFTELDLQGVSPNTWRHMITDLNVKSLMDVGCGRGISTSWFFDHGVDILCVEGSHDAQHQSVLDHPETQMVEHDFSRGPWWPEKTYDAVWAVEFLEHVGLNFHFNYISTFRKAALLFVSSSRWGGWHHVEVHSDDWWILKYEAYGLKYSEELTTKVRSWAKEETHNKDGKKAPNGKNYNAQHVWLTMKVFINPVVAALPEHAHLFYQDGCFMGQNQPNRPCVGGALESEVPKEFRPIVLTPEMDQKWVSRIQRNIKMPQENTTKAGA
jgi:hypothetical protein